MELPKNRHALVVMSGGQDSTTCLGIAMAKSNFVTAVTFRYGQKHAVEVAAAEEICLKYNIPQIIIDLSPVLSNMRSSALVNHGDTSRPHSYIRDVPASFVPARNALFLTSAYGLALELHCDTIYTGVCQTDYSGYPDCRDAFIKQLNHALNFGYNSEIQIMTPLMWVDKAETFRLADKYGVLADVINTSVTCYNGATDRVHEWGKGCGICPACQLRMRGYSEFAGGKRV